MALNNHRIAKYYMICIVLAFIVALASIILMKVGD